MSRRGVTSPIPIVLVAGNQPLTSQGSNADTAYKELITHNLTPPSISLPSINRGGTGGEPLLAPCAGEKDVHEG